MNNLKNIKAVALRDSNTEFNGDPLYTKGGVYYGVIDSQTYTMLMAFNIGNQVIELEDYLTDFKVSILSTACSQRQNIPETISQYLELLELRKWVSYNVFDKFNIVRLTPTIGRGFRNNVSSLDGGFEHVEEGVQLLALKHQSFNNDTVVQLRKGCAFYLLDSPEIIQEELIIGSLNLKDLKEVKFLIENDYKYNT